MFAIATTALITLVNQVSGTPYVTGGDSPRGTDCSGLASWVANAATGRPIYGDRFHTANEAAELRERGFQEGTAPGALNIGWNSGHTAVTLPDGTPVSAGEGGGVKVGGGGAFQKQFTHHMHLPVAPEQAAPSDVPPPPFDPPPPPADPFAPPPAPGFVPADFAPPPPPPGPADLPAVAPELLPAGAELPPPPPEPAPFV